MINIIAEIGCNHMGDRVIAEQMIEKAMECGVDFIKYQKRDIASIPDDVKNRPYPGHHSFGETYGAHRNALEFSINDWLYIIKPHMRDIVFPTVFDIHSLEEIMKYLKPHIIKIGSGQVTDYPLIEAIAKHDVKILMSTGMSTLEEIDAAYEIIKNNRPVLMQCTSVYPCDESDVNLLVVPELKKRYGCEVGLSGHYVSGSGAIEAAAVALGATWIERHFTLDRTWKGTDQSASLEPQGLKSVVKAVRSVQSALGVSKKYVLPIEYPARKKHRG